MVTGFGRFAMCIGAAVLITMGTAQARNLHKHAHTPQMFQSPRISYAPARPAILARSGATQQVNAAATQVTAAFLVLHQQRRAVPQGYQPTYRVERPLQAGAKIIDVKNPPPLSGGGARIISLRAAP